ncbi:HNH endonuclease signature motif containing protein, partial [Flaviaesturariibacter terrae]
GMAWLSAYLPAEQAHGIFNRVDAAARSLQGPDEGRTLSQLRADVFADVLTHTCTGDPKRGTGYRGVGASVFVTVPVMTLLGHQRKDWQQQREDAGMAEPAGTAPNPDSNAPDVAGCENGLLEGYGPIDPETARNLAAHAPSFTRILVHPETGAVLSVGRNRYRPPKHLQDWVRITNPTCIHPGCNRSSWSCEIDHVTPWAHGGKTALDNLKPRCKLHHMLKTEGIWPVGHDDE